MKTSARTPSLSSSTARRIESIRDKIPQTVILSGRANSQVIIWVKQRVPDVSVRQGMPYIVLGKTFTDAEPEPYSDSARQNRLSGVRSLPRHKSSSLTSPEVAIGRSLLAGSF